MRDSILRFIFYARKHPEKQLHSRFEAIRALGANRDFDWIYEDRKSEVVQKLCTVEASAKMVKRTWRHYKKVLCYYPEFYELARQLLKEAKSSKKKRQDDDKYDWVNLLY